VRQYLLTGGLEDVVADPDEVGPAVRGQEAGHLVRSEQGHEQARYVVQRLGRRRPPPARDRGDRRDGAQRGSHDAQRHDEGRQQAQRSQEQGQQGDDRVETSTDPDGGVDQFVGREDADEHDRQ
jgi:hypothetical protein